MNLHEILNIILKAIWAQSCTEGMEKKGSPKSARVGFVW